MDSVSPISTSGTKSSTSADKLSKDFDMFLTLLTTQLKNQDPLDPMDNSEMVNQLVQFSNVEQQIAQNKNLEQMILLLNSQSAASSVSYIGRDVQFTDSTTVYDGTKPVTFGYTPTKTAESVKIDIADADGKIIRTVDGERSASRHTFVWDGLDKDGAAAPAGQYTFLVKAKDASDKNITVDKDITGHVTGAASDATGNYLLIGDLAVDVTKVVAVRETAASS
ncbi:Flagellar hook capping protein [alpha proteobacterium BAL199]|jgi:flagellar basal-body rod modification protein FlgD|nr:Flagellar hook capping protein [alpha proteobacterium BAL199]